jgi:hypothetical protein
LLLLRGSDGHLAAPLSLPCSARARAEAWVLARATDSADSALTLAPPATAPKRVFLFMIVTFRAFRARVVTPGFR